MKNIDDLLNGYKINFIKRQLDMIMFDFEDDQRKKIYLHIQCFFRAKYRGKVLLSTSDMYKSKNPDVTNDFDWTDPASTLFDDSLESNMSLFINKFVTSVKAIDDDIYIRLENDTFLEIVVDTVEKIEMYRIFDDCEDILVME